MAAMTLASARCAARSHSRTSEPTGMPFPFTIAFGATETR
jgi:hypothetical protein